MYKTFIINQIQKIENGRVHNYTAGNRVRVLLKSESEYIGTIKNIYGDSFTLLVDDEEKTIPLDSLRKMRLAMASENFYNTWNF